MIAADVERFWSKVSPEPNTGCWLWGGGFYATGYGQFHANKTSRGAHVVAFELATGCRRIPGMHIDHLCRQPACVNPSHLELVTPMVNTHRGIGPSAQNARATHCRHGHEFSGANLYTWRNQKTGRTHRACRACHRAYMLTWRKP